MDVQTSIPMNLSLAQLQNKEPLLELLPALEPLEHHVRYVITHGNHGEHFRILERRDGKSILRLGRKHPLQVCTAWRSPACVCLAHANFSKWRTNMTALLAGRDRRCTAHQAAHPPALRLTLDSMPLLQGVGSERLCPFIAIFWVCFYLPSFHVSPHRLHQVGWNMYIYTP